MSDVLMPSALWSDKPGGRALVRPKEQEEHGDHEKRNTVERHGEKQHELERCAADAVQEIGIPDVLVYQPRSNGNAHRHENKSTGRWRVAQWGGCPEIVSPPKEVD